MTDLTKTPSRIGFRCEPEHRAVIEAGVKAAAMTLSDFLRLSALAAAGEAASNGTKPKP